MRFSYQFISSVAAQVEREEYVRDLPPVQISIDNRWYAIGDNTFNQLAPISADPGSSICNFFPVSSFLIPTKHFRDIASNGTALVIATSGLPFGIYGIGDNTDRVFGTTETPFRVLTALDAGNFRKIRMGSNAIYALSSTNGGLFYRGRNEPLASYNSSLTQIPGRYDDFEPTFRGLVALSGTDVYVKGFNRAGELGIGVLGVSKTNSITNMTLLTGQWKRIVACGSADHVLLLSATDVANIWYGAGDNTYNQLGQGSIPLVGGNQVTEFVHLSANWSNISIGTYHSIALQDTNAYGAGLNQNGQLGFGLGITGTGPISWTQIPGVFNKLPRYQGNAHSLLGAYNKLVGAGIADSRLDFCGATPGTNQTFFVDLSAGTSWADFFCASNLTFALTSDDPVAPPEPGKPTAPTITSVLTGNQQVTLSFTPATSENAPIINYEYSLSNGVNWLPFGPPQATSPVVIDGLENGNAYFISLRGVNRNGSGASSNVVIGRPVGPPGPPLLFSAQPGDRRISVRFSAGINGGATITNYQYRFNNGEWVTFSPAQTASPFNVTGLPDNQNITLQFRAINAFGPSIPSEGINSNTFITPIEVFLVGGGGGAGGGGGGGGGVIPWFSITPPSGASYIVRVGAPGNGTDSRGANSQFGTFIAQGGGGGGGNGTSGGSGGGGNTAGRGSFCGGNAGAGFAPQGYSGGYGKNNGNWPYTGGPGGGYVGPGGCHNDSGRNGWELDAPTKLMGPFATQGTNYVGSGGGYNGAWPGTRYGLGGVGAGTGNAFHGTSKTNAFMYGCGGIGPTGAGFQGVVCVRYTGTEVLYTGGDFIGFNGTDGKTYHIFTSDGNLVRIP